MKIEYLQVGNSLGRHYKIAQFYITYGVGAGHQMISTLSHIDYSTVICLAFYQGAHIDSDQIFTFNDKLI